jgi:hypothetical protein
MTQAANDNMTDGMEKLVQLHARLRKLDVDRADVSAVEDQIRCALDEVGRELMGTVFQAADIDDQEILVNGVLHGRIDRKTETIHTTFGPVAVEQTIYGRGRGFAPVVAMEKRLGLVEHFYTPKCAKVLAHLAGVVVREEAVQLLQELGGIRVGEATMHRLPLKVMARYERDREVIEPAIRQRSRVPEHAVTLQVGLDGVMVPQDGEHCTPRGREPADGEPDPPRHERTYGVVTPPGPSGQDDHEGRAWHEASVGTLAFYDEEGVHLATTYVGRMPESHKVTLAEMLQQETLAALQQQPNLRVVMASDGAHGNWEILAQLTAELPDEVLERTMWLADFHHVAGYLQDACDVIDGKGTPASHVRRSGLAATLKEYPDGAERVMQRLRHYRRKASSESARDELDTVIGYLENNRERMAYQEALEQNLPIATGSTEAAAKTLVTVRMKRSGARFGQHGGQTVLTIRAALKSHRFDDLFEILGASYKATVQPVRRYVA